VNSHHCEQEEAGRSNLLFFENSRRDASLSLLRRSLPFTPRNDGDIFFHYIHLTKNDCHDSFVTVALLLKTLKGLWSGLPSVNILDAIFQRLLCRDQDPAALLHNVWIIHQGGDHAPNKLR
jgi:hypothetical protein